VGSHGILGRNVHFPGACSRWKGAAFGMRLAAECMSGSIPEEEGRAFWPEKEKYTW
jgi:hypothetical protein